MRAMRLPLVAVSFSVLLLSQCTTRVNPDTPSSPPPAPSASVPAQKAPRPTDKAGCDKCKGQWARHGIAEAETCICRTSDNGKACRDGAECEGACLLRLEDKFEVDVPGPPPRGHYTGRCSEFDTAFGCHRSIPSGVRAQGPQLAEDASQHLCVD